MNHSLLKAIVLAIILSLAALARAEESITIAGTGDSQDILRQLASQFEAKHPGKTIQVPNSVGSSGGIKMAAEGKCDLGRIARPLKDTEKELGLNAQTFAVSPVAFAANIQKDCVKNLLSQQIVDIYSGRISSWAELGTCEAGKIYVAKREEGDSSRTVVEKNIEHFKDVAGQVGKEIASTPDLVEILSTVPGTIGYAPLASIKDKGLQIFSLDGLTPDEANLKSGAYRMASPFALVWKGELRGLAADFVAYLATAEAKATIQKSGLTPAWTP